MITTKLSSDVLENQFGPTTITILRQDDTIRVIQTVAEKTGQILELSLVRFIAEGAAAFPEVHQAVLAGQSMGKAFRAAGVEFRRETKFACSYAVPAALQEYFGNQEPATVVTVRVLAGPNHTPYAMITESYAPPVIWPHYFGKVTSRALHELQLLATVLPA